MAGVFDKLKRLNRTPDDEYEDDEYYIDDEPEEEQDYKSYEQPRRLFSVRGGESRGGKVVGMESAQKPKMSVVVRKPVTFGEETRDLADELLDRHIVVLILDRADKDAARRIVDFLSGVAYANHGNLKPIASNVVIVAPYNVDLSGDDIMDELESSGIYF